MFSIANLLERAKAKANIDSDYRLAKAIGKSHQVISAYRVGKSLPEESVIEQICALSGDDPGVIAAQIQAARSKSPAAKNMWVMIAERLAAASGISVSANEKAPELVGAGASQDWRKRTKTNPSPTRESRSPASNLSAAMRSFFALPPSRFV